MGSTKLTVLPSLFQFSRVFVQKLRRKLDNYFTHLDFWILHELDMIEP